MSVAGIERAALPPKGDGIFKLPVTGNYLSWTVDDGGDSSVIRGYAEMARDSGIRLTFFPNGRYTGWTENADLIAPMVATGQVEIGNHTFNHLDLTSLSDQQIVDELSSNDEHLAGLFGATVKPFYRPPFGYRNARTDAVAASIGYSNPVMWHGSLADSGVVSEDQLLVFAQQWFLAEHIIIGHANHPAVVNVFPQLLQLLRDRALQTVTLRDVFVV